MRSTYLGRCTPGGSNSGVHFRSHPEKRCVKLGVPQLRSLGCPWTSTPEPSWKPWPLPPARRTPSSTQPTGELACETKSFTPPTPCEATVQQWPGPFWHWVSDSRSRRGNVGDFASPLAPLLHVRCAASVTVTVLRQAQAGGQSTTGGRHIQNQIQALWPATWSNPRHVRYLRGERPRRGALRCRRQDRLEREADGSPHRRDSFRSSTGATGYQIASQSLLTPSPDPWDGNGRGIRRNRK